MHDRLRSTESGGSARACAAGEREVGLDLEDVAGRRVHREDDGTLVVVDDKTDAIPAGALASRVTYYRPQMEAYVQCLTEATEANVRAQLLFLHPDVSAPAVDPGA